MASYFVTSIVEGQWFYVTDASPDTVISAPRGSLAIRTDAGNESVWINVTAGANPGTNWERIISPNINGDLDLTGVDQITLLDNAAVALDIGSTGLLNLLRFVTTNGLEGVEYRGAVPFKVVTGGLQVVAGSVVLPQNSLDSSLVASPVSPTITGMSLELRLDYPAAPGGPAVAVLPARSSGFRVTDFRVVAGGAGGNVRLQTAGGASNVSNLIGLGAAAAGDVVRVTNLSNQTFAGGAQIQIVVGAGTLAGQGYITLEPT